MANIIQRVIIYPALLPLVLMACLTASSAVMAADGAGSSSDTILARDYPSAQLFMFAQVHGGVDFFNAERRIPQSLDEVIQAGYVPYLPAAGSDFTWQVVDGKSVQSVSINKPVYARGQLLTCRKVSMAFPAPGLSQSVPAVRNLSGQLIPETSYYLFEGAEYLKEGASLQDFKPILHRLRTALHVSALAVEFAAVNRKPAQDLARLEEFQGLQRNPQAWGDLQVVDSADAVQARNGNIFYGRLASGAWGVSVNLGPEVQEFQLAHDARGENWGVENRILFY